MSEQIGSLYARIGADASSFHRTMGGVSSSLQAGSQRFSVFGRAGSAAFGLIAGGGAAIGVLKGAISAAGEFQSTVAQLGVQTHVGAAGMAKMSAKAIALGADVRLPGTSASDAAEAMLELAKGGQKMGQVMKSVRGVLVASAAGEMSNADAANTVVGALGAFNLKAGESARVANLLAGGANASTASMQDMAFALQMGGSAAHAAHVPIQQFVALTAEMANAGIKGADAGTSLKSMFLALSPTSVKASKTIKEFGLGAFDAHQKMLPMPVIIDRYHKALAGMSDQQRISTLKTIFGTDAYRAANIIFGNGAPILQKLTKEVDKQGQAAKLAAAKNSGMKGAIDGVKSSWNTFQVVLGQRVSPAVKIASGRISTFVGDITKLIQPSQDATKAVKNLNTAFASPQSLQGPKLQMPSASPMSLTMPAPPPSFASGLQDAVAKAFRGIPWAQIGTEASHGFMKGLSKISDNVDSIVNSMTDAFAEHREQIADIGAQMIVAIGLKLADPSFWIKNWDLALGVALAAFPVGRIGKFGLLFLKPFAKLAGPLAKIMGEVVLFGAAKMGEKLGGVVIDVAGWIGKSAPGALRAAANLGVKVVGGIMNGLSKLGFLMRVTTYTAIVNVISVVASSAYTLAIKIGAAMVHGVVAGIKSAPGSIWGALSGAVLNPLQRLQGSLRIHSPSGWTRDNIGLPLVQGIIGGFLLGSGELSDKMSVSLRNSLEAAKTVVQSRQGVLSSAFSRLGEDVGRAFDAGTAKHLSQIASRFDKLRDQVAAKFAKLGQNGSDMAAMLTPAEQALKNMQDTHDREGLNQSLSDAQAAFASAQTDNDPAGMASAQRSIDDAVYSIRVADLQRQAEAERQARDAEAAESQAALDRKQTAETAALDKQQANAELQYQARRDLQKRHLEAELSALESQLEKNPTLFAKSHSSLMKWLKSVAGPDLKESGKNLGLAFAEGLAESQKGVSLAAHSLALELGKYLKLNSPAEKGPLASLDTWWTALPKTLLSGVDGREFGAVSGSLTRPGLGVALATQGAGGGGTTILQVSPIVEGILVSEGELATKIRDLLLPIARRNGGSIFGGAA